MLSKYVRKQTIKIQNQDLVEMKGICVGWNHRNRKCIVQLIKPALCSALSETVIQNGQKIEIEQRFIRKINDNARDSTATNPSLNPQKSSCKPGVAPSTMSESAESEDREPSWSVLMEDWSNIIGDGDVRSIEIDIRDNCDVWRIGDCDSCRRIEFCLSYYKLWIRHKVLLQNGGLTLSESEFAADMFRHEFLGDFLTALVIGDDHYSSRMFRDDWYHIKQFHITSNDGQNHSMEGEDQQDVFEFFKKSMGICSHEDCPSYSRNNRDRGECTQNIEKQHDLYFVSDTNHNNDKVQETNIQQMFDMVHCSLLHPRDSTTTNTTSSGKGKPSKFVTEVVVQKKESEQELNDGRNEEKTDGQGGGGKGDGSSTKLDQSKLVTSAYGFGTQFKYHSPKHKMYITPAVESNVEVK